MLRVNTPLSWAPTTHTRKPSPRGADSPLCLLSQEGFRTINSRTETNKGLSHSFPRITLPSWWDLMHTAAGGTSADPMIPFRSHSRPWSSPTQSRAPSPSPGSDQSQKWRLRALVLNAGSRQESSVACAHSWGEATHKNLRSVSDGGGVQNMPRQNASWSHVKPALSTSEGLRSGHLPLSSLPALLRLTRRVMYTYSIHHVITWHVYTVKYLSQSRNQHIHHLQIPMFCVWWQHWRCILLTNSQHAVAE